MTTNKSDTYPYYADTTNAIDNFSVNSNRPAIFESTTKDREENGWMGDNRANRERRVDQANTCIS